MRYPLWNTGKSFSLTIAATFIAALAFSPNAYSAEEPDVIFKRSTVFKWLTPNDKLVTYGLDDPEVDGVACHFTAPERGGIQGVDRRCRRSIGHLTVVQPSGTD